MAAFRTLQQSIADITRGSPQILIKIFQARKLGTFDSEGKQDTIEVIKLVLGDSRR
jgi:hypothetical protein